MWSFSELVTRAADCTIALDLFVFIFQADGSWALLPFSPCKSHYCKSL